MGRFSIDNSIEYEAFCLQNGLCARCGKMLTWSNIIKGQRGAWNAHHIDANLNNNDVSNCACLCINEPQSCHKWAHHGNYSSRYLTFKKDFPYLGSRRKR